ncbi:hypothetical protein A9K72_34920 [Mesorhizobium loti]|nr:hypothetical protein A9K72_34920 [Mesorhizobium loti]
MVIEIAGSYGEVLKFMTALTITETDLRRGLSIIRDSIGAVAGSGAVNPREAIPGTDRIEFFD